VQLEQLRHTCVYVYTSQAIRSENKRLLLNGRETMAFALPAAVVNDKSTRFNVISHRFPFPPVLRKSLRKPPHQNFSKNPRFTALRTTGNRKFGTKHGLARHSFRDRYTFRRDFSAEFRYTTRKTSTAKSVKALDTTCTLYT